MSCTAGKALHGEQHLDAVQVVLRRRDVERGVPLGVVARVARGAAHEELLDAPGLVQQGRRLDAPVGGQLQQLLEARRRPVPPLARLQGMVVERAEAGPQRAEHYPGDPLGPCWTAEHVRMGTAR